MIPPRKRWLLVFFLTAASVLFFFNKTETFAPIDANLKPYQTALSRGAVKVVFVGDSITEGTSQINYRNSWPGLLAKILREMHPHARFTFVNLSVPGIGIGSLADKYYVGATTYIHPRSGFFYTPNADKVHWPKGSVVGKNWMNHVRDESPDLIFLAFGMNDVNGSTKQITSLTQKVMADFYSFTKTPSIVLVSTILPSRKLPQFKAYQPYIQTSANVYRALAEELQVALIDANRHFLMHRDGVDIAASQPAMVDAPPSTAARFMPHFLGLFQTYGRDLLPPNKSASFMGSKVLRKPISATDIRAKATFTLNNYARGKFGIGYRVSPFKTEKAYFVAVTKGDCVTLSYNHSPLAAIKIKTKLHDGKPTTLEVIAQGSRHQVFLNGVKIIDRRDNYRFSPGSVVAKFQHAEGRIHNYSVVQTHDVLLLKKTRHSEDALLGFVDEYEKNPNSLRGNGINHPTKIGHTLYIAAAAKLLCVLGNSEDYNQCVHDIFEQYVGQN